MLHTQKMYHKYQCGFLFFYISVPISVGYAHFTPHTLGSTLCAPHFAPHTLHLHTKHPHKFRTLSIATARNFGICIKA